MSKIIRGSKKELDKEAARIIKDSILNLLSEKPFVVLAIPGGTSVSGIFAQLKGEYIPWSKVHIFMVDERMLPIDSEDSNFRLAQQTFLNDLIKSGMIPEKNIHPFLVDKGIKEYEGELKVKGGAFDIVLLSSGEDGHIGALYPNHHSIQSESDMFLVMNDSPKPPANRMTLSRKLLLKSKVALIMFLGKAKEPAFKKFMNPKINYQSCPAKLVQNIEQSFAFTDILL